MTTQTTHPSKQDVRLWLNRSTRTESPPQSPEEIRRALGWNLIPSNGTVPEVRSVK